ncbi:MAG: hypothetical protein RRA94_13265, partial [Bacteroidota bacterium]|nr:hypothetical protein [Bacteroidota bacterium]
RNILNNPPLAKRKKMIALKPRSTPASRAAVQDEAVGGEALQVSLGASIGASRRPAYIHL